MRFAIERLLYRLSESRYRDAFVLKGATLFSLWMGTPHRATKDLDLLGSGSPDLERVRVVFKEVAEVPFAEDGVFFEADAIIAAPIREDVRYEGVLHAPMVRRTLLRP